MNIEVMLTIILTVAITVERLAEIVKPIYLSAKEYFTKQNLTECTKTEKIIMTILIGPILCILSGMNLNIPEVPVIAQQVIIGLAASVGSNILHALIGLVAAFKDAAEGIKPTT